MRRTVAFPILVGLVLVLAPRRASAQELEPGAYWPLPRGLNIVTAINSFNTGDVAFDPSAPIDEATATINTTAFAFMRAFALGGRSANASVMVPIVAGHLEGLYFGEPAEVDRFGLSDPRVKVAVNLYGAPTMRQAEFAKFRMRTLVGVSLTVVPPLGQYKPTQLVNIGNNRWSFKPEVGVVHAFRQWLVEGMAGAWLFTENDEFRVTHVQRRDPVVALQVHLTYRFQGGMWLAADANYYVGGRVTVDSTSNPVNPRNSRVGATFSKALTRRHSIRASFSQGAYTTIGGDFTSIAVGYNYAWVN